MGVRDHQAASASRPLRTRRDYVSPLSSKSDLTADRTLLSARWSLANGETLIARRRRSKLLRKLRDSIFQAK
jgi:hypothetical protein